MVAGRGIPIFFVKRFGRFSSRHRVWVFGQGVSGDGLCHLLTVDYFYATWAWGAS
jgi:hypothetical protein